MRLKRLYAKPEGWAPIWNECLDEKGNPLGLSANECMRRGLLFRLRDRTREPGELLNRPPVRAFAVVHTGTQAEQNFSDDLVHGWINKELASIADGKLVVKCEPDNLVYTILRAPGYYCSHCGAEFPDGGDVLFPGVTVARQHVLEAHGEAASPDPSNPLGYSRLRAYQCRLEAGQHEQFKLTQQA